MNFFIAHCLLMKEQEIICSIYSHSCEINIHENINIVMLYYM